MLVLAGCHPWPCCDSDAIALGQRLCWRRSLGELVRLEKVEQRTQTKDCCLVAKQGATSGPQHWWHLVHVPTLPPLTAVLACHLLLPLPASLTHLFQR